MALSVLSNFTAAIALNNLTQSQQAASNSIAKLSSGSRVVNASDDAASLAIGSGLRAEVAGLNQASINAGQGISVLQIADGSYARVNDILVRLKTIAVQAASGQLSGTQRGQLNTEYSGLISEVDRIANVTDFNGTQLVNGGFSFTRAASLAASAGFDNFALRGSQTAGNYSVGYNTTGNTFTVGNSGESFTGAIASSVLSNGGTSNATLTQGTVVTLSSTTAGSNNTIDVVLNAAFSAGANIASAGNLTASGTSSQSFAFQVGANNTSNDSISVSLSSTTSTTLGINTSSVTSAANAQNASTLITNAINQLQTFRATVGAGESRLQFAQANIATASANLESARSNLLDVNVAQEVSNLASKQILNQLGVAELAQADQLPQTLLRLLQ